MDTAKDPGDPTLAKWASSVLWAHMIPGSSEGHRMHRLGTPEATSRTSPMTVISITMGKIRMSIRTGTAVMTGILL